jgi:uncharacterized protein (TIGR02646 family)
MRPVEKGEYSEFYNEYQDYKRPLLDQIGEYCSYCERPVTLAVEHVKPKSRYPELECDWENLLLGCSNCNGTKTDKDPSFDSVLFPNRDNTFRAFHYSEGGIVTIIEGVEWAEKARATLELVGLDRTPSDTTPKASDLRWEKRREAWDIATVAKEDLKNSPADEAMRRTIIEVAKGRGFWSIWMSVFQDDNDMKQRLIEAFQGTAVDCFDANNAYSPLERIGGHC